MWADDAPFHDVMNQEMDEELPYGMDPSFINLVLNIVTFASGLSTENSSRPTTALSTA